MKRTTCSRWVDAENVALLTDLYQLTMLQAYWREGMEAESTFSLYYRELPEERNYLLACGLHDALCCLRDLRFGTEELDYLADQREFQDGFLRWLEDLRFEGDVWGLPEGTPVFPREPLLEVVAPLPQAQLAETVVMNQVHFQSVAAAKASRVVAAARGRAVVDFGLRRMHGADAGIKAARAFHVAGVEATSNVLAGKLYGLPITGTMAHSYIQAHDSELEAFREFSELYPGTILLVDTYDTLEGVRKVCELAEEKGDEFSASGIRLDSGDLGRLAVDSRRILDEAGLDEVEIFASGGLDEYEIRDLLDEGAPIDGFGVGTRMGVARGGSSVDMAYKLVAYSGKGRMKTSTGKQILPGRKQIFRMEQGDEARFDLLARFEEETEGRPLLEKVMEEGEILPAGRSDLDEARSRAETEIGRLPPRIRDLGPADSPYEVRISDRLQGLQDRVRERVAE